ncbi:MAG: PQQ-binding-like beta-propeller repeat protein [Anaerolineae bacterium]|nr:PQQ-binding-like beta-propeller repeat protein [Anaerolineae bacterium]
MSAQPQCGYATAVQFPVDPTVFFLAQDFGAASPRHQGRQHTGEDWSLPDGTARGQIVVAPAAGRVAFSSANAWGGDGGVIILEHTFPDGAVAYSMFGHLTDADGITFPPALGCVRMGEPLATIADVRPAPHVHIEIRTGDNLTPGAGYSWETPEALGLRHPTKFLTNQALQFNTGYRWRVDLADEAGPFGVPVVLDDQSLIYLDGGRVNRITNDGRLLWRTPLSSPAAGLFPSASSAWIAYADGRWQAIGRDGTLLDVLDSGLPLARTLLALPSRLIAQAAGGRIAAFSPAGELLWISAEALPEVISAVEEPASGRLALMARDVQGMGYLALLDQTGGLVESAALAEPAPLAFAPGGVLWTYTRGGLWWVDEAGEWTLADPAAAPGGRSAALTFPPSGERAQFDGSTLTVYAPDGSARWQTAPGYVEGPNSLQAAGDKLLLVSASGDLIAWRLSDGAECGRTRLWGGPSAWAQLGPDGVLRAYIADQIAGLDWDAFTRDCG